MLTDKEYETFLMLMEKIVNQQKPVIEKESELVKHIEKHDMEDVVNEFMGWDLSEDI